MHFHQFLNNNEIFILQLEDFEANEFRLFSEKFLGLLLVIALVIVCLLEGVATRIRDGVTQSNDVNAFCF